MLEALPQRLLDRLGRLIGSSHRVVIAVSGGPDSVALATAWAEISRRRGDVLRLAHFDHRLRAESADDARFVEELGERLGLPVEIGRAERPLAEQSAGSIEESARNARYAFLQATAQRHACQLIATGHHRDDQIETILLAILRGTGLRGLSGMPAFRPISRGSGVLLVRPLLDVPRDELLRFVESRGVGYRFDPTNSDPAFTRNRLRHELLPMLRNRFNAGVDDAIGRLVAQTCEAADLIDSLGAERLRSAILEEDAVGVTLLRQPLADAKPIVAKTALRLLWERRDWPRKHLGSAELARLHDLLLGEGPQAWDLPGGLRARRDKDRVRIEVSRRE